jgi:hypothetical protein
MQLSAYCEKFFYHSVFTNTDPATIYNIRETPVPVDNTKRCDFCNESGHVEEGCFHRDPLQLIYNPPEKGYPDGKLHNDLLIKHPNPHNLCQARISTASELSGDPHGHRKLSKKEYDWDNNLPRRYSSIRSPMHPECRYRRNQRLSISQLIHGWCSLNYLHRCTTVLLL